MAGWTEHIGKQHIGRPYEYFAKDHLGNVQVVFRNDNGMPQVIQKNDYYPFGLLMQERTNIAPNKNRYLYNGKEYISEGDLNWYDYGARMYDPAFGRWHTPDPLCEVNRKWSPYRYAYNNPLRYIDPDGMLEDGYTIDEDGYIERVNDTGGEDYDVLYTKKEYDAAKESGKTNAEGNPAPENNVKVEDTSILPALSEVENVSSEKQFSEATTGANSTDALAVFKFASDNSKVEWSLTKFSSDNGLKYSISTYHNEDFSPGLGQLGISESSAITRWHSHPGILPSQERSSMGETSDGSGGNSDLSQAVRRYYNNGNKETYPMNVYFPTTGNFYHVSPYGIKKIGTSRK